MKKTILISLGILIILIVLGIWAYLFTYGTPKNSEEVFARFGFGDQVEEPVVTPETAVDVQEETPEGAPQKLRQLTTKPVAGAVFTETGIRYVEEGTGHVYDIDLQSGDEILIEGTTIPRSIDAIFSDDGRYVAITALNEDGTKTVVEEISAETSTTRKDGVALPLGATSIAFGKATGTVMYLLKDSTGSAGYLYNIIKGTSVQVFRISLRDARVLWGTQTYVYTTPTSVQVGHVYEVVKNELVYIAPGKRSLMALPYSTGVITTYNEGDDIISVTRARSGETIDSTRPLIPEKCIRKQGVGDIFYCGVPSNIADGVFPDDWYKGAHAYVDMLWEVDVQGGKATLLSNPLTESGREMDVAQIGTNKTGEYIYMINKNDNTLWMFDTTSQE